MINLPPEFSNRMKSILNDEYIEFLSSYTKNYYKGLRVNTLKCSIQKLKDLVDFELKETNFSKFNFYIPNSIKSLGKHPLHHAGAFYIQEPSASSAVTALNPEEGDKVLDLCAAPGGKSTQIAALLNNTGLLWANEFVKSRANILLSNIERMGIKNSVVSSLHPDILCSTLEGYFDKVLVDAPCSGEGMFRKEPHSIQDWSYNNVIACSKRQLSILESASKAVKLGGIIVYSTCTFSKEENEGVVDMFLSRNKDFEIVNIENNFGRDAYAYGNADLSKAKRIFPMDKGEGHFVAKLKKVNGEERTNTLYDYNKVKKAPKEAYELYNNIFNVEPFGILAEISGKVIILPKNLPDFKGLPIIRSGVLFGEIKKSRIEPSHNIFMVTKPEELKNVVNLSLDSEDIRKFLKGEEIQVNAKLSGYTGVAVESIMVGFGKCSNSVLKNKYPKGLRNKE